MWFTNTLRGKGENKDSAEMSRNYNNLWPEQARAKWLVQKAVQRGKLVKPGYCQRCRTPTPSNRLQAHHYNYAMPLDVSWLCDACHKAVHKELSKCWKELAD